MAHLQLVGLTEDNKRLRLVDDSGEEHTLLIDARLRAALGDDGQRRLEIQMESTLRPRDIQARIRAGETPEAVATAAKTTVDRIMPYVNPVLAERAHIAQRAQRSSVRRKSGDTGVRTLGDAVSAQLRPHNVSGDTVEWDAWRREDGRWTLTASYHAGKRHGTANFTFDAPGNYVTLDDDDARWLVGESPEKGDKPARAARDDLKQARQRRLTAVEDELPLGEDALELVSEPDSEPSLAPTPEPLAEEPASTEVEATPTETPDAAVEPEPAAPEAAEPEQPKVEEPEESPAKRPAKKKGRASVPSWDEIMFGGGKQD